MKRGMPIAIAALLALSLAGCGAVYTVSLVKPDGTKLDASARDYASSDSVSLTLQRDAQGEVQSLVFSKTNTQPLSQISGDVLRSIIGLVPGVTASPPK